jgi:hypothetical protein
LIKPTACEKCGAEKPKRDIAAHHPRGYDEDHILDVEWLCRSCHAVVHSYAKGIGRQTKEQLRENLQGRMTHDQLAAAGHKGGTRTGEVMRARYTPAELSEIKRRAAIKGNQIRWGSK